MLLGSSPNRRLTKDETQSPTIAEAAASAPSCHAKLITTAAQTARSTAAARPRQVFERPSRGWPSHNTIPRRSGAQIAAPASAPIGPAPHWLRRREQGFGGSPGRGRTFTFMMVDRSRCRHPTRMSSRLCRRVAKNTTRHRPPQQRINGCAARRSATHGLDSRRTPFETITCRQLKVVRSQRPPDPVRHRRHLFRVGSRPNSASSSRLLP